jgi:hypothetical protein
MTSLVREPQIQFISKEIQHQILRFMITLQELMRWCFPLLFNQFPGFKEVQMVAGKHGIDFLNLKMTSRLKFLKDLRSQNLSYSMNIIYVKK